MAYVKILGLDVGDAKIGAAISDLLGLTAQPLELIRRDKKRGEIAQIKQIIKDNDVKTVVVGLPRASDGNISEQGVKIKKFCDLLEKETGVEIVFRDEYLSTQRAQEILIEFGMRREKRRQHVDKIAAALILQGYLDGLKFEKKLD